MSDRARRGVVIGGLLACAVVLIPQGAAAGPDSTLGDDYGSRVSLGVNAARPAGFGIEATIVPFQILFGPQFTAGFASAERYMYVEAGFYALLSVAVGGGFRRNLDESGSTRSQMALHVHAGLPIPLFAVRAPREGGGFGLALPAMARRRLPSSYLYLEPFYRPQWALIGDRVDELGIWLKLNF